LNINKLNNDLIPVKTNYEIENKLLLKILSTKKPLHFREGKNVKIPKNGPRKSLIGLVGQFYPLIKMM